jgi:hypothetical protein
MSKAWHTRPIKQLILTKIRPAYFKKIIYDSLPISTFSCICDLELDGEVLDDGLELLILDLLDLLLLDRRWS